MNYEKERDAILADQSASEWLKRAVLALDKRDPVDAFGDAAALAALTNRRRIEANAADVRIVTVSAGGGAE